MIILHIVNSFFQGGSEKIIHNISINDKNNYHIIICLKNGDFFKFNEKIYYNVKLIRLNINKLNFIFKFIKLIQVIKKNKFDIIHTWNYHADFIGILLSVISKKKIIWNIVNYDISIKNKLSTYILIRLNGFISRYYKRLTIINCSKNSIKNHSKIFKNINVDYIPLGFSKKLFDIDHLVNKKYIKNKIFFGFLARYHKIKNFELLFEAISLIKKNNLYIEPHFLIAGSGITKKHKKINELIKINKLENYKNLEIIENVKEVEKFFEKINFFIMTSKGEGFPNSIGESMSFAVPCISSNVGDIPYLIDSKNLIYELQKTNTVFNLIDSINNAINIYKNKNSYLELCKKVNNKINNEYNILQMINNYRVLWEKTLKKI